MIPLSIAGSWVFIPVIHEDDRGSFLEWFRGSELADDLGYHFDTDQANCSVSRRGVVRGVHSSDVPPGQAKYVTCVSCAILDVVVDLRRGSPSYGRWAIRAARRSVPAGCVSFRRARTRLSGAERRRHCGVLVLHAVHSQAGPRRGSTRCGARHRLATGHGNSRVAERLFGAQPRRGRERGTATGLRGLQGLGGPAAQFVRCFHVCYLCFGPCPLTSLQIQPPGIVTRPVDGLGQAIAQRRGTLPAEHVAGLGRVRYPPVDVLVASAELGSGVQRPGRN